MCDRIQPLPQASSCLTDRSFPSGSSDWEASRQEESGPVLRAYYESGAVHAQGFHISNSTSQLPDEIGLSSLSFVDEEIEAQKAFCCCLCPSPKETLSFLQDFLLGGSPTPSPVALHLAQGPAWPLLPSPHITFLVCCPLPAWLCC